MGTRGFIGFVVDGVEKITYNHFDSYPSGVGIGVLKWLKSLDEKTGPEARQRAADLVLVNDDDPVTQEQAERLAQYTNTSVGARVTENGVDTSLNWYQALRDTQGDPAAALEAGFMIDNSSFALDSLFCEWAYLIDFDRGVFQVYRGFQKSSPTKGRWVGRPTPQEQAEDYEAHLKWCAENNRSPWQSEQAEFHAVQLVAEWSLFGGLPSDVEFLALENEEED